MLQHILKHSFTEIRLYKFRLCKMEMLIHTEVFNKAYPKYRTRSWLKFHNFKAVVGYSPSKLQPLAVLYLAAECSVLCSVLLSPWELMLVVLGSVFCASALARAEHDCTTCHSIT